MEHELAKSCPVLTSLGKMHQRKASKVSAHLVVQRGTLTKHTSSLGGRWGVGLGVEVQNKRGRFHADLGGVRT